MLVEFHIYNIRGVFTGLKQAVGISLHVERVKN